MAKTQDFEFRYAACRGRHSLQTDYGPRRVVTELIQISTR